MGSLKKMANYPKNPALENMDVFGGFGGNLYCWSPNIEGFYDESSQLVELHFDQQQDPLIIFANSENCETEPEIDSYLSNTGTGNDETLLSHHDFTVECALASSPVFDMVSPLTLMHLCDTDHQEKSEGENPFAMELEITDMNGVEETDNCFEKMEALMGEPCLPGAEPLFESLMGTDLLNDDSPWVPTTYDHFLNTKHFPNKATDNQDLTSCQAEALTLAKNTDGVLQEVGSSKQFVSNDEPSSTCTSNGTLVAQSPKVKRFVTGDMEQPVTRQLRPRVYKGKKKEEDELWTPQPVKRFPKRRAEKWLVEKREVAGNALLLTIKPSRRNAKQKRVPECEKDERYEEMRMQNTLSSRKSRQRKRKLEEERVKSLQDNQLQLNELMAKVEQLEVVNSTLKSVLGFPPDWNPLTGEIEGGTH